MHPPDTKPWMECAGELAHLHEETLRIQALIDEEFGQIEAEDWVRVSLLQTPIDLNRCPPNA